MYRESTGETVAVIPGARSDDPINENTRLIAAAPELLDACKGIVDCCDYYLPDRNLDNVCRVTPEFKAILSRVQSAILKATNP